MEGRISSYPTVACNLDRLIPRMRATLKHAPAGGWLDTSAVSSRACGEKEAEAASLFFSNRDE
jgi:hypothetical protein